MSNLNIFLKEPDWGSLVETISALLGTKGSDATNESGGRHVWKLFTMDIIAIKHPELDDDNGIPFSTFTSEVDLVLHRTDHSREAEAFRYAFAVLFVLRLRNQLDPETRLVQNLQREIKI